MEAVAEEPFAQAHRESDHPPVSFVQAEAPFE